jgi:hypothetical protein
MFVWQIAERMKLEKQFNQMKRKGEEKKKRKERRREKRKEKKRKEKRKWLLCQYQWHQEDWLQSQQKPSSQKSTICLHFFVLKISENTLQKRTTTIHLKRSRHIQNIKKSSNVKKHFL